MASGYGGGKWGGTGAGAGAASNSNGAGGGRAGRAAANMELTPFRHKVRPSALPRRGLVRGWLARAVRGWRRRRGRRLLTLRPHAQCNAQCHPQDTLGSHQQHDELHIDSLAEQYGVRPNKHSCMDYLHHQGCWAAAAGSRVLCCGAAQLTRAAWLRCPCSPAGGWLLATAHIVTAIIGAGVLGLPFALSWLGAWRGLRLLSRSC